MGRRVLAVFVLALLLLVARSSYAQGVQTGSIAGVLKSWDDVTLPEATVVATSPALQGERSVVSDINGVYVIAQLPPGKYTLKISKAGLAPVDRTVTVPLGGIATVDVTLAPA